MATQLFPAALNFAAFIELCSSGEDESADYELSDGEAVQHPVTNQEHDLIKTRCRST